MITILGASGFIGSHLVAHLRGGGIELQAPAREESLAGRHLGHVIYCIGLTADFRERPWDALDAHVCKLMDVLRTTTFDSFLYLSSTRLYIRTKDLAREDDDLGVNPLHYEDLYNLSKATGESIVLSLGGPNARVARPSNVYGSGQHGTFLSMILDEARGGAITLRSAPHSERDYVSVADVAALLAKIALQGTQRIYNVASGTNVRTSDMTDAISRLTGCTVSVAADAPASVFPRIDTQRIRTEFGFTPRSVLQDLPSLIGRSA